MSPLGSAYKVGHGIMSGMRTIGTLAAAASNRISTLERDDSSTPTHTQAQNYSRSAPAASLLGGRSPRFGPVKESHFSGLPLDTTEHHITLEGTWIAVVDLKGQSVDNEIHRFRVSGSKPVTRIEWNSSGTIMYCATSSGQSVIVYSIRPEGVTQVDAPRSPGGINAGRIHRPREHDIGAPWHLYDLHRGHSSANILNIVPNHDGRWVAAATQRGTVHIFATNPYGGPTDVQSHVKGRVVNPDSMVRELNLRFIIKTDQC